MPVYRQLTPGPGYSPKLFGLILDPHPRALQSSSAYILFYLRYFAHPHPNPKVANSEPQPQPVSRRDMDPTRVSLTDIYPPCQPETLDLATIRKKKWMAPVRQV